MPRIRALTFFAVFIGGCNGLLGTPPEAADPDPASPVVPPPRTPAGDRPAPPFEPGPGVLPRLTGAQYRNTLIDIFERGLPRLELEPDTNPYLFYSIGAASTSLSEVGADAYANAATEILDDVFPTHAEAVMGCVPQAPGDACVRAFIERVARRLYRRPLTTEELDRWTTVTRDAADGDALRGVRLALYGLLQSPAFLYRLERGEPDPDDPTRRRYTSFEMASRLSFLLWNRAPDEALLDAAGRGELVTDEGLRREALRLLASPRAHAAVQDFFAQYFDLGRLDDVDRDPARYPLYSESLVDAMRSEVRLLVQDLVFRQNVDIRQIFSTRRTFVNRELAALYGVDAPGATEVAFVPAVLPDDGPRAGLLTLGAFLAMNAHPTDTSPTLRGKYVRERVLCQTVPAPPDNVDTSIPPSSASAPTLRERLEQHRTDPACSSCHSFTDPPGFLFEGFDSIGAFRTEVNGQTLDTTGNIDGQALDDARGLASLLSQDPRVPRCLVEQLYRHAQGRLDQSTEEQALRDLDAAFRASGYRFQNLLLELVLNVGFRTLEATP